MPSCIACGSEKEAHLFAHLWGKGSRGRCKSCSGRSETLSKEVLETIAENRALRSSGRKRCQKCRTIKSLDSFHRRRGQRAPRCKACVGVRSGWATERLERVRENRELESKGQRRCSGCLQVKPIQGFSPDGRGVRKRACRPCHSLDMRKVSRDYRKSLRYEAIRRYGGRCECCSESRQEFLAIDHPNGGGCRERKSELYPPNGIAGWLKKSGWPTGAARVLCHNCNASVGRYGYCPHRSATSVFTEAPPPLAGLSGEALAQARRKWVNRSNYNLKLATLGAYGGSCRCCGEGRPEFLSIDHIDGGGNQERSRLGILPGYGTYRHLRKSGYPPGYQVLCENCNLAKSFYGRGCCPHRKAVVPEMVWKKVSVNDPDAKKLADRHYSNRNPGRTRFAQPAAKTLVLMTPEKDAVWVTSWPYARMVERPYPDAWLCSLFRNESRYLSSDLIRQAVAATEHAFGPPPESGMVTFVDSSKVRRKRDPGRCFIKAGFAVAPERTKKNDLVILRLPPDAMPVSREPL